MRALAVILALLVGFPTGTAYAGGAKANAVRVVQPKKVTKKRTPSHNQNAVRKVR